MKPEELRIGNYVKVYRHGEDAEMTNHQIKSIVYINKQGYHVELNDGFVVNSDTGIEPIPLTRELFMSLGFKYNDPASEYYLNGVTITYCLDFVFSSGWSAKKIKYVHQLQNMYFALKEEELKLKL